MNRKDAETSIRKYEKDRDNRKHAAIDAINSNDFWGAAKAINEASQCEAVINEYRFILDLIDVEGE